VFVALTYSLLQLHLLQEGHQELNRRTVETTRRRKRTAGPSGAGRGGWAAEGAYR
jgi:hypothetical protein